MKNNFFVASLALNTLLASFFGYHLFNQKHKLFNFSSLTKTADSNSTASSSSKPFKIAIFTPISHPSLEKIEEGFRDGLTQKYGLTCSFDTYNANGNRTLMYSQAEEIIQKDYDLIYTIGAMTTQMAKEVSLKKNKLTPIVFGVVARPEKLNLIESRECSGNHLTGLTGDPNYEFQINMLHFLKPDMKKVLLIYDPTQSSGLEYDKQIVEKILGQLNVQLIPVEVYKTNDVYSKAASMLNQVDTVLIFKDNTVVSGIDSLIKLCNREGIPLCTTDLDSVPKGAAIGFSITSYDSGFESSEKAYAILAEGKHPSAVPITQAHNFKVMINEKSMATQKLTLNTHLQQLISSVEVIR